MQKRMEELNAGSFDWTLIRSFLAVLEAGGVSAAARASGIQQPTLSRHVAELETQLGVALFERSGRALAPTAIALAIADSARQMERAAHGLANQLVGRRDQERGTVRISASHIAASYLLPAVIVALQQEHPQIEIELVASNQLSNLLRREADIALRMVRPRQPSLIAKKIGEVAMCVAAHEGYLKRHGVPRQPAELGNHRLLGYDKDDLIIEQFRARGLALSRAAFALRTDDHVAYARLVAAGAGLGFLARYSLPHLPGVVAVLPELKIAPLPCWLAVHREIAANRAIRSVYDYLAQALPARL